MRRLIVGLCLVVFLIVFLVVNSLLHRPKHVALYRAAPGGTNIQFPYLAGPHLIEFFTGSSFATYDTSTQTSQTISPQFILPTVSSLRWSKAGVLFRASDYAAGDDLYAALIKKNMSPTREYWWRYDFASQKMYLLLPANPQYRVVDAAWNSSGNGYCYVSSDGFLYSSRSPIRPIVKVSADAVIKQFGGNMVTVLKGDELKRIDISTRSTKTLVKGILQDAYVSSDGKTIAYVAATNKKATGVAPGDLYRVDPSTGKAHKVMSEFSGVLAGGGGDIYAGYAYADGINHLRMFPKKGKSIDYSLGKSLNKDDLIGNVLPVDSGMIYVVSKTNNLVEVTNREKFVSVPISYRYRIQTDLYENGFEIHYDPYKDTYEVGVTANPYPAYQKAALDFVRAQTVDPNQIRIIWRAFEGVDSSNPAVDTSPVPEFEGRV